MVSFALLPLLPGQGSSASLQYKAALATQRVEMLWRKDRSFVRAQFEELKGNLLLVKLL
jgi:hypothetical protein